MSPLPPSIVEIIILFLRKFVKIKPENPLFLKTKNRSIESQYVFDLIVVEFVIVSPSCASFFIEFKGAKSNQETGMLVKFLQIN